MRASAPCSADAVLGDLLYGPDVFISYSREDRAHARRFAQALAGQGWRVWWDDAIHSGQTFDTVIEQELRAAKAVVVLWSPRSVTSRWVRSEASIADRNNRLVPAVIEPCDRPIMFELTHTTDLSHWDGNPDDAIWQVFIKDLSRLIEPEDETPASRQVPLTKPIVPTDEQDEEFEPTQFVSRGDRDDFLGPDRHCLELQDGDQLEFRIVIGPAGLRVGRAPPADLVVADPLVSRSHCKLEFENGELKVVDLNSTNGTFVDGKRVEGSAPLAAGGTVGIGSRTYVYAIRDKAEV